jgi:hypothetical protein
MTDLQLSLIGASAVFIVLIFIYNKWQEYRARKSVDQVFSNKHDDVLMQRGEKQEDNAQRQEPQFSGLNDDNGFVESSTHFENEVRNKAQINKNKVLEKELSVDELIDCVIPLEFETPQRGEKLLEEIADLRFVGKKAVHVIGINQHRERDEIAYGNSYTSIFAGVQMVNRSGPLNELEYSEFVSKLRLIADRLNADSDIPDMNRVMETARELHQFVAEHDAQLSVNVLANGAPWDITSLLAALEKQGFDIRPDGRLSMSDGDTGSLFTLSTNVSVSEAVTSKLTLLLDVPCVSPNLDAFGAMSSCARMLASRLGGTVVDDGHQAISKDAVSEIAAQVADFYAAMEEAQIPAGSRRAQRLFS